MSPLFLVVIIVTVVLAIAAIFVGLRRPDKAIVIEERLAQFGNRMPSLEEVELQLPFQDRVLLPALANLSKMVGRFAPSQNSARLRQQLLEAGAPKGLGPTEFTGLRVLLSVSFGSLLFLLMVSAPVACCSRLASRWWSRCWVMRCLAHG